VTGGKEWERSKGDRKREEEEQEKNE